MGADAAFQGRVALCMLAAGAVGGAWYDVIEICALLFKPGFALRAALDFLFALGMGALTVAALLMVCAGEARLYALWFLALGFACYRLTLGRLFWAVLRKLRDPVRRFAARARACKISQRIFR